jgi:acyl-CoA dehydrogenase family protein 10
MLKFGLSKASRRVIIGGLRGPPLFPPAPAIKATSRISAAGLHSTGTNPTTKAVIFDVGGVVVPSPFPLIDQFEIRENLSAGSINQTIRHYGAEGSFRKLERGELTLESFCRPFSVEYSELHGVAITPEQVWGLAKGLGGLDKDLVPYKEVMDLMVKLKSAGIKIGVVTNNFKFDDGRTVLPHSGLEHVDVFVESCIEGVNKPDIVIYQKALDKLGVEGSEAIFLDDIGGNLKTASQLGIITIKVDNISDAMKQVEDVAFANIFPKGTQDVSDKLQLPVDSLVKYLKDNHNLSHPFPPLIRSFSHGQSNPTYFVKYGDSQIVLRKKPPGKLLPSAHAVEREYRIMKSLQNYNVPIPPLLSLCEDSNVLGTPFYLMEYVPGNIFKDLSLPSLQPPQRKEVYHKMCHTLASIHNVDINEASLNDFGKTGDYVKRQISRWSKQYESSKTHDMPAMDELIKWLNNNSIDSEATTVVHGDYRLDNLIYSSDSYNVLAVLDWELSTLGDPLSDLSYCCMPYYLSPDNILLKGLNGVDVTSLGIPTEEELLSYYCTLRGLKDVPNWSYYMSFTFFRISAILQGVYKRSLQNQASSDNAKTVGGMAESFAQTGLSIATRQFKPTSPFSRDQRRSYSTSPPAHTTSDDGICLNSCVFYQ